MSSIATRELNHTSVPDNHVHVGKSSSLFPLPTITYQLSHRSARARQRFRFKRCLFILFNLCILTFNRLYYSSSPSPTVNFPVVPSTYLSRSPSLLSSQPDNISVPFPGSSAQQRLFHRIYDVCSSFLPSTRTWVAHSSSNVSDRDREVQYLIHSLSSELSFVNTPMESSLRNTPIQDTAVVGSDTSHIDIPFTAPVTSPSIYDYCKSSIFSYTATASVVPLRASRVSLPDNDLHIIPMQSVLPPDIARRYTHANSSSLLRPPIEQFLLDISHPLHRARVAGSRSQYIALLRRMVDNGMISFTSQPKAVNGVFTVSKDEYSDRLIIDAQPANRHSIDSPSVHLPDPSHLLQLQIPPNAKLYTGKSDLSNYYHQLGLPGWMQPYFCLPPLTPDELQSLGAPTDARCCFPMCLTLPMGFSHAVYIAQSVHEHVLYRAEAVHPRENILRVHAPLSLDQIDSVIHGIYIDDFFHSSLSQTAALRVHHRVLSAYVAAGFVIKSSKVIIPTAEPVKVLGIQICGVSASLSIPADSQLQLLSSTLAVLHAGSISGVRLSRLIGSWTWCLLLRRPALSILHRVYRFMHVAGKRKYVL